MWENEPYCWVVFCKNQWFHQKRNFFCAHKIVLAQTDSIEPLPPLVNPFVVRCDACGKEYSYASSEVLRYQQRLPVSFAPHPLFEERHG